MSEQLRIAGNIQSYMSGDWTGLTDGLAIPQPTTTARALLREQCKKKGIDKDKYNDNDYNNDNE